MPFEGKTVPMYREEFVTRCLNNEKHKAALCREYGISRPTGDKWIKRFRAGESMDDRSRAPFRTNRISRAVEEKIIAQRLMEPALGAVKLRRMLMNQGEIDVPCASTVNAVLKRNNLITKEASEAATPYKRFEKEAPNVMWQADFKGHYALENGVRCHPLSVLDDHSRFCLCADAKEDERLAGTMESFTATFRTYGLPQILLCDNGSPWGNSQTTSCTRFEIWLMDLGILPIHIRPKHPQTQGKVERFNGSYKRERLSFYTPRDMADAQARRLEYREFYNNVRPHHALALNVPATRYSPSARPFPEKIEAWEYDAAAVVHKVKSTGYLYFSGQGFFIGESFGGKNIAIIPSATDGIVDLLYRQFRVAQINLSERCVISRKIYLVKSDPRPLDGFISP